MIFSNLFLEAYKNRGLMEGVSDRVLTKRKMIVSEARKLITLAESAKMPESTRRTYMSEAQKAIIQVKSGKLSEAQLDKIGEGIWGGVSALGKAAGRGIAKGAKAVGGAIASGAKSVGTAVGNVANKAGEAVKGAANQVGQTYQQGSNAQDAKQAIGSLNQISQFLAKTGFDVGDHMTIDTLKQALQQRAGGGKVGESLELDEGVWDDVKSGTSKVYNACKDAIQSLNISKSDLLGFAQLMREIQGQFGPKHIATLMQAVMDISKGL